MALIIKDSELAQVNLSAEELKLEMAVMLYQRGKLSAGQASKFAGISRIAFQKILGERKIEINYTEEDLDRDFKNLNLHNEGGE